MGGKIKNATQKYTHLVGEKEELEKEELEKETKGLQSSKEDLQVSSKRDPIKTKCGRSVKQGTKQTRPLVQLSW